MAATQPLDFQQIILKLQEFWGSHGCVIWQPYDVEKGAGTFNPATFLRSLGPEPWRVAYVEPSRRPTDGRYGENPNRLGKYYQFQVIIKPAPEDAQQLYVESLQRLGIDMVKHDLRFVEDDWEQPSVGAAGLGWEVWLDGQEVSQYTYFQQVGSVPLDPICVEYTYGLERLASVAQGVESVYDIVWVTQPDGRKVTYGDVHHQDEVQFSHFNFTWADIELHRKWFDEYERQAQVLLDQGLVLPAYDFVMKASHSFNVLNARNAVGVAQRDVYIGRCRKLAQRVAEGYVENRRKLGFPLLADDDPRRVAALAAVEAGE
ncbi:MAG: glycine--tRNA ligase subunit alpha [Planctomycetota bacterium]